MIDGEGPSRHRSASTFHRTTPRQYACISAPRAAGHGRQQTISCSDGHLPCQTIPHPATTTKHLHAVLALGYTLLSLTAWQVYTVFNITLHSTLNDIQQTQSVSINHYKHEQDPKPRYAWFLIFLIFYSEQIYNAKLLLYTACILITNDNYRLNWVAKSSTSLNWLR